MLSLLSRGNAVMSMPVPRASGLHSALLPRCASAGSSLTSVCVPRHSASRTHTARVKCTGGNVAVSLGEQAKAKESSSGPPAHMLELLMLRQQVAALQAEKQLRLDAQMRAAAEWDLRQSLSALTPRVYNAAACILRRICSIDGFHGSSANTLARAMSMDNVNDVASMANAVVAAYDGEPPFGPSLHALDIEVGVLRSVVDPRPHLQQHFGFAFKVLTAYDRIKRAFPQRYGGRKRAFPERFGGRKRAFPLRLSTSIKLTFPDRLFKKKR